MKPNSSWATLIVFSLVSLSLNERAASSQVIQVEVENQASANAPIEIYVPKPGVQSEPFCTVSPEAAIERIIASNGNNWGILVESLQDGKLIYGHNADRHFIPASNVKLFTTAAALQSLDPDSPIRSTTLREWITSMNLRSDNDYAETLSRYIGGVGAEKSALSRLGLDPNSYRLADGSGLSRSNIATPRSIVSTLRAMYFSPNGQIFENSLPIAGISGTLRNRMRLSPAEGRVHAKTGTLTGVRALSGYIENPLSGILVFSILVNHRYANGSSLVKQIDTIATHLSAWKPCNPR